jgi:hypothetical protein
MSDGPLSHWLICPGIGQLTRRPGVVVGTEASGPKPKGPLRSPNPDRGQIWEWQWAQKAMYAHFFAHYLRTHGLYGVVVTEAEFAFVSTAIEEITEFFEQMGHEFRREHAKGGQLRPDIFGAYVNPRPSSYLLGLELLEVTTHGQATKTLREDVTYKLEKLRQIANGRRYQLQRMFSSPGIDLKIGPATWRPDLPFQRVVPLPPRADADGKQLIEWICFQPTYGLDGMSPIDGLLLYEVHSVQAGKLDEVLAAAKQMQDDLAELRRQQALVEAMVFTPFLTPEFFERQRAQREMALYAGVGAGIGLLALGAYAALPVIAGLELAEIMGVTIAVGRAALTRVAQARALASLATALEVAARVGGQWAQANGIRVPALAQ